jgi:hypothetical protein
VRDFLRNEPNFELKGCPAACKSRVRRRIAALAGMSVATFGTKTAVSARWRQCASSVGESTEVISGFWDRSWSSLKKHHLAPLGDSLFRARESRLKTAQTNPNVNLYRFCGPARCTRKVRERTQTSIYTGFAGPRDAPEKCANEPKRRSIPVLRTRETHPKTARTNPISNCNEDDERDSRRNGSD